MKDIEDKTQDMIDRLKQVRRETNFNAMDPDTREAIRTTFDSAENAIYNLQEVARNHEMGRGEVLPEGYLDHIEAQIEHLEKAKEDADN